MAAALQLMSEKRLQVGPLITHRFAIGDALSAYDLIRGAAAEPFLGVVLTFPASERVERVVPRTSAAPARPADRRSTVSVLGSGNFAIGTLLPAFREAGASFSGIGSGQGVSASTAAGRFHARYATTDERRIIEDPDAAAIVIATRHHLHTPQALAACAAGKHVFVEKPLCLTDDELRSIVDAFSQQGAPMLMVGYNRRFAPFTARLRAFFADVRAPKAVQYRVNAGYLPRDHWTQDPRVGGGRVVGEVCHFVDWASCVIGERPQEVSSAALPDAGRYSGDNVVITLRYPGGSVATISYLACGTNAMGKERIEVSAGNRGAVLDDFRSLTLYGRGRPKTMREWLRQDKGHRAECRAFMEAIAQGRPSPIPLADLAATSRATFAAIESARTGAPVSLVR
jgi:predicted dehydrogenase